MQAYIIDWLSLVFRWIHVIVGIAWIGSSFYFIWKDNSLEPVTEGPEKDQLQGDIWMVHGGGFYYAKKYTVAPAHLPEHLHWFKWESYATWMTGFVLLVVIYYFQADAYLLAPGSALSGGQAVALGIAALAGSWAVYDGLCRSPLGRNNTALAVVGVVLAAGLAWGVSQVFSGRGAFVHMGAILGTIMAANVFMVIIPNQRRAVQAMRAGQSPDPRLGKAAKQRSLHNNYLTLPVLFLMVSNHYPITYATDANWLILIALALIGGGVRHFFNLKHKGQRAYWILGLAAVAIVVVAVLRAPATQPAAQIDNDAPPAVPFALAGAIVEARCAACHSATPSDPGFDVAPQGVMFDTPAQIAAQAAAIAAQAVDSEAMPLGNLTNISPEERILLGRWIADGARIDR